MSTDRNVLFSIEELASAARNAKALLASGVLEPHERTAVAGLCDRIDAVVKRKHEEEPTPLRPEPAA